MVRHGTRRGGRSRVPGIAVIRVSTATKEQNNGEQKDNTQNRERKKGNQFDSSA